VTGVQTCALPILVGALDRVERVLLGVVLGGVPERRVDAALGRAGVAADGMDLGKKCDVSPRVMGFDRGAHTGTAGADDEDVVLGFHQEQTLYDRPGNAPRDERRDPQPRLRSPSTCTWQSPVARWAVAIQKTTTPADPWVWITNESPAAVAGKSSTPLETSC